MQLFCAAACFLFTSVAPLQASNSPAAQTAMLVAVRTLVHLRYFLKAAVLHYFPSGVER